MQNLANTSTLGTSYTADQVYAILSGPTARENYRVYLTELTGTVTDISSYVEWDQAPPVVTFDSTAAVMGTCPMQIRRDGASDLGLTDRLTLVYQLSAPDGGWLQWQKGVFTPQLPGRTITLDTTWLTVSCADLSQLLQNQTFDAAGSTPAGASYVGQAIALAQSYGGAIPIQCQIVDPGYTLPQPLAWSQGDTYLATITALLAAINYEAPWFDEQGVMRARPIIDYTQVVPSWTFDATAADGITIEPITETPDMSKACNSCLVTGEDPRTQNAISARYTNNLPTSPISTVNWGQTVTQYVSDSTIPSAGLCWQRAKYTVQQAAQIYDSFDFPTLPWPVSQCRDIYGVQWTTDMEGTVSQVCLEQGWEMTCRPGADTAHTLIPVVPA